MVSLAGGRSRAGVVGQLVAKIFVGQELPENGVIAEMDPALWWLRRLCKEFQRRAVNVGGGAAESRQSRGPDDVFMAADGGGLMAASCVLNDVIGDWDGRGRPRWPEERATDLWGEVKVRVTRRIRLFVTDLATGDGAGNLGAQ